MIVEKDQRHTRPCTQLRSSRPHATAQSPPVHLSRHFEDETRPFALRRALAVHVDLAPHEVDQTAADGQPQPCAAVLARGPGVGLLLVCVCVCVCVSDPASDVSGS